MYNKILMLFWERWRRTRWAVILVYLLPLIGQIMYMTGYISQEKVVPISKTLWYLGFLFLTIVLLAGHCESKDLDFSFPKRTFRYPVNTLILFLMYIGYGVVAVTFQSLILFVFEKLFSDQISFSWTHFTWFLSIYIVMQTLSWLSWLTGPEKRFLFLAPLLTGLYVSLLLCFGGYYNPSVNINSLFLTILISLGFSFWGVSGQRKGAGSSNSQWVESLFGIFHRKPSKPFTSAMQAQIWFESRQKGLIFPLSVLCTIGILLIWWEFFLGKPQWLSQAIPIMFMITGCTALISNFLIFGLNNRDYVSGASIFWMRRPVHTQSLAVAQLYTLMRSLLYVIAIIMLVTLAIVLYEYDYFPAQLSYTYLISPVKWTYEYKSSLEIISMTVIGLYGFFIIYWTMLRLGMFLSFIGGAAFFSSWLLTIIIGDVASTWVWKVLIFSLPLVVLISYYVAWRLHLITTATLLISALVFPLVVVSLWAFPWWFFNHWSGKGLPNLSLNHVIMLISAATLPFFPVALTPLIMNKLRHR